MVKITFYKESHTKLAAQMPISHLCQLDGISVAWLLSRRSAAPSPAVNQATTVCSFNLLLEFSEYSRVHQVYIPSGLVLPELYRYLTPQKSQGRGERFSACLTTGTTGQTGFQLPIRQFPSCI